MVVARPKVSFIRGLRHSQPLPLLSKTKNKCDPGSPLPDRWRDQKRIEDLDETVRKQEADLERLRQEYTQRVAVLEAANAALIRDNVTLMQTNASLTNSASDNKLSELQKRFFELQCFASDLVKVNNTLQARVTQLEQVVLTVSRCNDDLARRNVELVAHNGVLTQRVGMMEMPADKTRRYGRQAL